MRASISSSWRASGRPRCFNFLVERGIAASQEVEDILVSGRVQLVEYENLEREYLKHMPFAMPAASQRAARIVKR